MPPADAPVAADEEQRLRAVRRYDILDTPPDGAFDRICSLAARFFRVPVASVTIVDEDRIWFKACEGLDATEIPREPGLCASAILADHPYVVTDAASDPRTVRNSIVTGGPGVRFYAAAPIVTRDGHRLGTINVIDTAPREVSEEQTRTLHDLAAIVMDELELRLAALRELRHERELREAVLREQRRAQSLAQTLQRSLSPPTLPQIPGLELAVHYEPFAAEEVGGDFYDVFPLSDARWGFFLGDISGKGPEAASLTSLARYTLRTAAMLKHDPAAALRDLNAALAVERPGDTPMCTVVYGTLDPSDPDAVELRFAAAGHPPPVIVRAGGDTELATARGPVLGAFAEPQFDARAVTLGPGDVAILYSDGILDLDLDLDGTPLTEDRLAALLQGAPAAGANALVERVLAIVAESADRIRDDVAILALGAAAA